MESDELVELRPVLKLLTPVLKDENPVLTLLKLVNKLLMPVDVEVDRLTKPLLVVLKPVLKLETPVLNC